MEADRRLGTFVNSAYRGRLRLGRCSASKILHVDVNLAFYTFRSMEGFLRTLDDVDMRLLKVTLAVLKHDNGAVPDFSGSRKSLFLSAVFSVCMSWMFPKHSFSIIQQIVQQFETIPDQSFCKGDEVVYVSSR